MSPEAFVASAGIGSQLPVHKASEPVDERLAKLPSLLRVLAQPGITLRDVRGFMETLVAVDDSLFEGAQLFVSLERLSFVLAGATTGTIAVQGWNRWPLRRLFAPRRPCVITHPGGGCRALAVPFTTVREHYVVVAVFQSQERSPAQIAFLESFEALALGAEQTGLDLQGSPPTPTFLWCGQSGPMLRRMQSIADAQGWPLHEAVGPGHAMRAMEVGEADVLLFDGTSIRHSLRVLRGMRVGAGDIPILYVASGTVSAELRVLTDACIDVNASAEELLRIVKQMLPLVPQRRREALQLALKSFRQRFSQCNSYEELTQEIAAAAFHITADWCALALVDRTGGLYRAEFPRSSETLMETLPSTFLSGEALVRHDIDDTFLSEIAEDGDTRRRLLELQPRSAAALPIVDNGTVCGTLLALTNSHRMTEAESQALSTLSHLAGESFSILQHRRAQLEPRSFSDWGLWKDCALGEVRLVAYRGRTAESYATLNHGSAHAVAVIVNAGDLSASFQLSEQLAAYLCELLEDFMEPAGALGALASQFGAKKARVVAAVLDTEGVLTYACEQYPAPVQVPLSGPSPVLRARSERRRSVLPIRVGTVTLLYGVDLAQRVDSAELVTALQRQQRAGHANPSDVIPDLSGEPDALSFVAITR
jgi:hypothetical protein